MTDHSKLTMCHADRRVSDLKYLIEMLKLNEFCTVAFHDEPFPYVVPMNAGFEWNEGEPLTAWLHMAVRGHRLDLIQKNPNCALNVSTWLDRVRHKRYRKEPHDYRSVTIFGKAEIISADTPEEYLHGLGILAEQHNLPLPALKISPFRHLKIKKTGKSHFFVTFACSFFSLRFFYISMSYKCPFSD